MHVGILTYQTGHLKTWQVMTRVRSKGFRVTLYAFPFVHRPPDPNAPPVTRFQDRPAQLIDYDVPSFCEHHGVGYIEVDGWEDEHAHALGAADDPDTPDVFLHCFAKIVPASFLEGRRILNSHPGLLPQNRGVDAFKWSILNKWPVGVTLHIIDAEIDRGLILARQRVPVFTNDTLRNVADRAYEYEVDLMGNFEHHLDNAKHEWGVDESNPLSRKRIPEDEDARLADIFTHARTELVRVSSDPNAQPHPADGLMDFRA